MFAREQRKNSSDKGPFRMCHNSQVVLSPETVTLGRVLCSLELFLTPPAHSLPLPLLPQFLSGVLCLRPPTAGNL